MLCVCSEHQHRELVECIMSSIFFAMINALNSVNRQQCSYKMVTALVQVQIKLICKCTLASNQARCGHIEYIELLKIFMKFLVSRTSA